MLLKKVQKYKEKKDEVDLVIKKLNNFLCIHIEEQMAAGADVVQIFDSWAGLLPKRNLNKYCYIPNAKLVNFCKKNNTNLVRCLALFWHSFEFAILKVFLIWSYQEISAQIHKISVLLRLF